MAATLDYPLFVLITTFAALWGSAQLGSLVGRRKKGDQGDAEDYVFILGGTLTLLGLIIGFTFSMAVGRYDQRKNYEEQEANAIGTEYVRADLMPEREAESVRGLLRSYVDQRIRYYQPLDERELRQLDVETARLQREMWGVVASYAVADPSPVAAVVVAGMNDVLNSQGYTQAAWWNRIPIAAWVLVILIAVFCNFLIGYGAHGKRALYRLILPATLSVTLLLIAAIDSPRGGFIRVIHVQPRNLQAVTEGLRSP
jgi:hypothetical protein